MREKTKLGNLKLFLIFAGPAAVLFLCVVVIPFLYGLVLTFTNWNGISDGAGFVAFQNYVTAFKDTAFWHSLLLTLGYVAASVILINLVAFFLAYLLTSGIKGQNFLRSAFFTPNLIGGIVLGFIWQFVFNNALTSFGSGIGSDLLSSSWLSDPTMAFWALVVVTAWQYSGYMMIIYVAGFTSVSHDLLEAASIDGCTAFQTTRYVTLPLMVPSFVICLFLSIQRCFMVYDVNLSPDGRRSLRHHHPVRHACVPEDLRVQGIRRGPGGGAHPLPGGGHYQHHPGVLGQAERGGGVT